MRRLLVPVIAPLLVTACTFVGERVSNFMGGEDNIRPPTPLQEVGERIKIKRLWETGVGGGTNEQYLKLVPAYDDGRIFAAESDGDVSAVNSETGRDIWTQDVDVRITGGPGVGEDLVVVGTGKADVIALSPESGDILWQSKVSSEVLAAPQIDSGIVVVRTIDGKMFGLNADDGARLWVYDRSVPALTLRGTSPPVISNGLVIAGFDEGRLVAIELQTGKLVWETRIALGTGRTDIERMVDIDAKPVVADGIVYVATFQGRVAALTADGGRITWARDIPSYAGINVDDSYVYISADDGAVWALDRTNGNSVWKLEDLLARSVSAPALVGDVVVVGDVEGYLHWLDRQSGEIYGRNQVSGSPIIAPPFGRDSVLYAYASDGTLGAYNYLDNPDYVPPEAVEEVTEEQDAGADGESGDTAETADAVKENEVEKNKEEAEEEEESLLRKLLGGFGDDEEDSGEETQTSD